MARTKNLIAFPELVDFGGDLSKGWYIQYSYYLPLSGDRIRKRLFAGLNVGTERERRKLAKKIIAEKTEWLKNGAYLDDHKNVTPVRRAEVQRKETKLYVTVEEANTFKVLAKKFITDIAPSLTKKTLQSYNSHITVFHTWLVENDKNIPIQALTRNEVLEFFRCLADRNLSRRTIAKYKQRLHTFWEWCIENEITDKNIITKIPKYGLVVDCSPVPLSEDHRTRLKEAIEQKDPYLWLACELIYYSAIRPGELRLLKIKDIDIVRNTVKVVATIAKNRKTEIVSVPASVIAQMKKLGVFAYDREFYLFGRYNRPDKEPTGHNTLRNRFNLYREALNIPPDIKFYSWKHTGAIQAIDNGIPIMQLKEHLRHSSVSTTEVYIKKRQPKGGVIDKYLPEI